MNAIFAFVAIAGAIIVVWALGHLIGGDSGSMNPLNFFVESSTMGTILILVVYFLANLALPFYYRKYRPQEFSVRQARRPAGPGHDRDRRARCTTCQARPAASRTTGSRTRRSAIVVVSVIYAIVLNRRDPGLGDRVGSIVADE